LAYCDWHQLPCANKWWQRWDPVDFDSDWYSLTTYLKFSPAIGTLSAPATWVAAAVTAPQPLVTVHSCLVASLPYAYPTFREARPDFPAPDLGSSIAGRLPFRRL